MGLITKIVIQKWNGNTKKWYENKGYIFTKTSDEFEAKVEDLSDSSNILVDIKCDNPDCENPYLKPMRWNDYIKHVHKDGIYYCGKCAIKLNRTKIILNNGRKSFYKWCIENSRQDVLDRWDYELNEKKPDEITTTSLGINKKGYWFKCLKHPEHKSELKNISNFTKGEKGVMICKQCNSFGQWCLDNGKQSELSRWDYKLNNCNPFEVSYGSGGFSRKGYYFKCPKGIHPSELKNISHFTNGQDNAINCKACNSFAQYLIELYGENALNLYWDWDKNNKLDINPWIISKCSNKPKIFIICQEKSYHDSYNLRCNDFYNGDRCPFCSGRSKKVHLFDSLGYLFPEVMKIWSDKNKLSPYEYTPKSGRHAWFKCKDDKHEDYFRLISSATKYEFRCPECVREHDESFLQEKVRLYLESLNYGVILHEYKCTIIPKNPKKKGKNNNMPFDNEIIINTIHLIIEVHGEQHYRLDKFHYLAAKKHGTTPEHELHMIQVRDRYKRFIAHKNGYEYIAISYKANNKKEEYKCLIDDKLKEINNINVN